MRCQFLRNLAILFLALIILPVTVSGAEPVSKNNFTGIALGGSDSVAYHRIGSDQPHQSVKGDKSWDAEWKGATWLFTSKADRDLFAADPEKYSPAYNGFCANALSLGEGLFKTDGSHWQIFDGQLYTFYAERGRKRWLAGDFEEYKAVADRAWAKIITE
jgi:hypothetical protein